MNQPHTIGSARSGDQRSNPWHDRLYRRFRDQPYPLFVFEDRIIPAASVWTGCRRWVKLFRSLGLRPGERIVLACEPSPAFMMVLLAGLWERVTICVSPSIRADAGADELLDTLDARAVITDSPSLRERDGVLVAERSGIPREDHTDRTRFILRNATHDATPDTALMLRTSGTSGHAKWVCLSSENVLSVLDSHMPAFGIKEQEVIGSVVPWHHAFGLVIDLLPAIFSGAQVVRDEHAGRDPRHMIAWAERWGIERLSMVPLQAQRLVAMPEGLDLLRNLRGGVVGGAPIDAPLARELRGTSLRVGYGQTECGPGVTLGQPGEFTPGHIGAPVGCEVRLDEGGHLLVRGGNTCIGTWNGRAIDRLDTGRWHDTGDVVAKDLASNTPDALRFIGRADHDFKLSNGRRVPTGGIEDLLRTQIPHICDVVVLTRDGRHIEFVLLRDGAGTSPALSARERTVRDVLATETRFSSLARLVSAVHQIDADVVPRTVKGAIDRPSLTRELPAIELSTTIESKHVGSGSTFELGPDVRLTHTDVERLARADGSSLSFSEAALERMERSRVALGELHDQGREIYGLTTGFGPFVVNSAAEGCEHGAGLIAHLGAGWGPIAPREVVRAALIVRAQTIAQGMSGIEQRAAEAVCDLLAHDVTPAVPAVGSVGASGDLIPLSHCARAITGDGFAIDDRGERIPASLALQQNGLSPLKLSGRDALAIVNGTAFSCGYATIALARAERLLECAERLTGYAYRTLGARSQAIDPRYHEARGHAGQIRAADAIHREASRFGAFEDDSRPLQEVYSIRCAPQMIGAARDQLEYAADLIEREINGVNDNPLVWTNGEPDVIHGGNFQGQQLAFACDAINNALVQVAILAERQLDVVLNPEFNGGAPLLLAWDPGPCAGMAGAQITATAITAEMRHHGGSCATTSMPTNGRNQDIVSMCTLASRVAHAQTERLAAVLGILCIGIERLNWMREQGRAPGNPTPAPDWLPSTPGFTADHALNLDIDRVAAHMLEPASTPSRSQRFAA